MNRCGHVLMVVACAAGVGLAAIAGAQPTFGPKTRPKPAEPAEGGKPAPASPEKPPTATTKPRGNAPGASEAIEEWTADDAERHAPDQDLKPGAWYCWKTTDGLRYSWSLPAPYEKGKAYDLIVMLHPAQMDFRWGPSNHQRGEDGFRPDCITVSVDGIATNPRRPDLRSFEPTAENCVRFRDVMLEFSRVLPVRHIFLYGQGSGGRFAAYFSAAFPALADGVLDHGGGMVEQGAAKTTVPMVFMHGAKDSITSVRQSVDALKAYQEVGHKGVRLRVLREYNDFPNENSAADCLDYLRAMRTDDPMEVVRIANRMLTPKPPDEFGYRAAPWCAGAAGALARLGTGPGTSGFEKDPPADALKARDALLEKIEKEADAHVANIRALLRASGVEKGDFVLDGAAWLGYLLAARDDYRGVQPMEKLAAELKLDAQMAAHAEQAAELWTVWSVSASEADKFTKAVEQITRCYLCEGLPVDLLPRCRACLKKADELEIDSASRNMYEFIQLWEQGWKDGLEAYRARWQEWELE